MCPPLEAEKASRSNIISAKNEIRHLIRSLYLFGAEKLSVRHMFRQVRSL